MFKTKMPGSDSGLKKFMNRDQVCPERLDPDPDPDAVNFRPDPTRSFGGRVT